MKRSGIRYTCSWPITEESIMSAPEGKLQILGCAVSMALQRIDLRSKNFYHIELSIGDARQQFLRNCLQRRIDYWKGIANGA